MAFNPNNPVDRVRLLVGDRIEDEPFLENSVYTWLYTQNGNDDLATAIAALKYIINYLALSPTEWRIGESSETRPSITVLEGRLAELERRQGKAAPILIGSDRKNWCDFDDAFGRTSPNTWR